MKNPLSIPNLEGSTRADSHPYSARLWSIAGKTHGFDNRCHHCNRCFIEAGAWFACEHSKCDGFLQVENFLYAEPLHEAFKHGGFNQPLLICSFVGNC